MRKIVAPVGVVAAVAFLSVFLALSVWVATAPPPPTEPPCWEGIVISRHASDRVFFPSAGVIRSRQPVEFFFVVQPFEPGPPVVISAGADEEGFALAGLLEPGSVYSTCHAPTPVSPDTL